MDNNILWYCGGFEAMIGVGDYIYAMAFALNMFVRIDINTGKMEFLGMVPNETKQGVRLYVSLLYANEKIYFIPLSAKEIAVYDLNDHSFKKLEIPICEKANKTKIYNEKYKFCDGTIYDEYIYFFSATFPAHLRINTNSMKIELISDWVDEMEKRYDGAWDCYSRSILVVEDDVYMPCCYTNVVMKYSLKEGNTRIFTVGKKEDAFSDIVSVDDGFYLTSKRRRETIFCDKGFNKYQSLVGTENHLSMSAFPVSNKEIRVFEYNTNKLFIQSINNGVEEIDCVIKGEKIKGVLLVKGVFYLLPANSSCMVKIYDGKIQRQKLIVDHEVEKAICSLILFTTVLEEDKRIKLTDYIEYIV